MTIYKQIIIFNNIITMLSFLILSIIFAFNIVENNFHHQLSLVIFVMLMLIYHLVTYIVIIMKIYRTSYISHLYFYQNVFIIDDIMSNNVMFEETIIIMRNLMNFLVGLTILIVNFNHISFLWISYLIYMIINVSDCLLYQIFLKDKLKSAHDFAITVNLL